MSGKEENLRVPKIAGRKLQLPAQKTEPCTWRTNLQQKSTYSSHSSHKSTFAKVLTGKRALNLDAHAEKTISITADGQRVKSDGEMRAGRPATAASARPAVNQIVDCNDAANPLQECEEVLRQCRLALSDVQSTSAEELIKAFVHCMQEETQRLRMSELRRECDFDANKVLEAIEELYSEFAQRSERLEAAELGTKMLQLVAQTQSLLMVHQIKKRNRERNGPAVQKQWRDKTRIIITAGVENSMRNQSKRVAECFQCLEEIKDACTKKCKTAQWAEELKAREAVLNDREKQLKRWEECLKKKEGKTEK